MRIRFKRPLCGARTAWHTARMAGLTALRFSVAGGWAARTKNAGASHPWIWEGEIGANRPVTALMLLRTGSELTWGRCRRFDSCRLAACLRIDTQADGRSHVGWRVGLAHEGGRRAWFTLGARPDTISARAEGMTGEPSWLFDLGGEPNIQVGAFVIAEADTRGGRNGIWHLADALSAGTEDWTQALRRSGTGTFV